MNRKPIRERLLKAVDGAKIAGACLVVSAAVGATVEWLWPQYGMAAGAAVGLCSVVIVLHQWKGDVDELAERTYHAAREARAMALVSTADGTSLLPWSDWALAPDVLLRFMCTIRVNNWTTVVECGSGISTVLLAREFKARGRGHVYAIEHDEQWLCVTRQLLEERGLAGHATLILAPLKDISMDGQPYRWYDVNALQPVLDLERIDALLVDGPPKDTCSLARYPALPLLLPKLGTNSLVVLDDGRRRDETEIARRWATLARARLALVETTRGQWELRRGTFV